MRISPVDDTDREADEVELAGLHDVGVLRHLAAEERAPGLRQPSATPATMSSMISGTSLPTEM